MGKLGIGTNRPHSERVRLCRSELLWYPSAIAMPHHHRMRDHKTLKAWIEAHGVVNSVFDFCESSWRRQARAAFDQLQRASLSVQLNIAEGYARRHPKPFLYHLATASRPHQTSSSV